jgi:hypothetical protein
MKPRIPGDYPTQPRQTDSMDQKDPLFIKYCSYRAAMANQLVTAMPFANWKEQYIESLEY